MRLLRRTHAYRPTSPQYLNSPYRASLASKKKNRLLNFSNRIHGTTTPLKMPSLLPNRTREGEQRKDLQALQGPSVGLATVNRSSAHYDPRRCLAALSAHQCVPFIENQVYADNQVPDLELLPSPRLFATHMPSRSLPSSVPESGCKVVYLRRDVKDSLVSMWHFINKVMAKRGKEPIPIGEYLDWFCSATYCGGPFWDHVLGYWKASLERPDQVLFLRYEDMMEDTPAGLKKLAEFVGCPFTADEEKGGAVEDIVQMCSFENLSSLEVNKTGATGVGCMDNSMLFRRGVVGDWANYLTPQMARHLDEITETKFKGSGLAY